MAKSDIEIAREAILKPINEIADKLDIPPSALQPYGHDKAKLKTEFIKSLDDKNDGKLNLGITTACSSPLHTKAGAETGLA